MPITIQLTTPGGAENLSFVETPKRKPGEGEVMIRQTAIGLNYIDIYMRNGEYKLPEYPAVLGMEAAGVVEEVGEGVEHTEVGNRVFYISQTPGAYTEYRTLPESATVRLIDTIPEAVAAGVMLKAFTARFLTKYTYRVFEGSRILVHAAAGGAGSLVAQMAKAKGAIVIGTVGSDEKKTIALRNGCDYVINYRTENLVEMVNDITAGKGINTVYDSVGKDTFQQSIDCLMDMGLMVSYGQSSGAIPPIDLGILRPKSLFLTRPQLFTYIREGAEYVRGAMEIYDMIITGELKPEIGQTYRFKDIRKAHEDMESRRTKGSSVLIISKEAMHPKG